MTDAAAALKRCRALRELSGEDLGALAELVEPRGLDAGSALFRETDEADELLIIAEGTVRLERGGQQLGRLAAGEILGGACLAAIGRRACDAIADQDVQLLVLSRGAYLRLRADGPAVALALHEALLRELAAGVRALVDHAAA